jgi:hypothetical protein
MIRIDEREDCLRNLDAWREIDLHSHLIRRKREPRGLQVLIKPVCACTLREYQQDACEGGQRVSFHRFISFAP